MSSHPAVHVPADTPLESLDAIVDAVRSKKDAFIALWAIVRWRFAAPPPPLPEDSKAGLPSAKTSEA